MLFKRCMAMLMSCCMHVKCVSGKVSETTMQSALVNELCGCCSKQLEFYGGRQLLSRIHNKAITGKHNSTTKSRPVQKLNACVCTMCNTKQYRLQPRVCLADTRHLVQFIQRTCQDLQGLKIAHSGTNS